MKNVLFLVTGMTPQIITETVWALACDKQNPSPWIPDEIHVLSTQSGIEKIQDTLFQKGILAQMKQDFPQLSQIKFDDDCLYALANAQGDKLNDLKTPEDNELAANLICQMVREFTEDDQICLHVSIAGGRKTMGFYAGYALSLYGRAQDRMSHVLVEERYESARDFFYPSANETTFVTNRDGKELKAKDAQIWLADIPFVRMREAIMDKHQLKQNDSFSKVVSKINESFKPIELTIDTKKQQVIINNGAFVVELPAREFAMLHWFADLCKQGKNGIIAPTDNMSNKNAKPEAIAHILKLSTEYRQYYNALKIKDVFDEDDEELKPVDVDKRFFEAVKSLLKSALEEGFGLELANKIKLKQDKRGEPFYLDLPAECVHII